MKKVLIKINNSIDRLIDQKQQKRELVNGNRSQWKIFILQGIMSNEKPARALWDMFKVCSICSIRDRGK